MTGNKLVLKRSEINLLKFSNFIKKNETPEINDAIFSNSKISQKQLISTLEDKIVSRKDEWIALSSNEWQPRKVNPIIINKSENKDDWKRCSLCNRPNKLEFYVVNKYNNETINIGGTCSSNVVTGEMNELAKLIKDETAGNRYVDITSQFPELRTIIFTPKKMINNLEYELPTNLDEQYENSVKVVVSSLKKFLNTSNDNLNKKKEILINSIQSFQDTMIIIKNFQTIAQQNDWSLSKKIRLSFQTQPNSSDIIKEIKNNSGKIDKRIAQNINAESFLTKFIMPSFNKNNKSGSVKIIQCLDNKIIFEYKNEFENVYNFKADSKLFISYLGDIIFNPHTFSQNNIRKFFITNANSIIPNDISTKKQLLTFIKYSITDSNQFFIYDLHGAFASSLDNYHYEKFEILTDSMNVFRKSGEDLLYIFNNEHVLVSTSVIMLFQDLKIQEKTLQQVMKKAIRETPSSLFTNIKENIYKENIL